MSSVRFDVDLRGPVFDGRLARTVDAAADQAETAVGEAGVNMVRRNLAQVLRDPTGYYESQIQTDRASADVAVTDGGVLYGPWLEGVSSRNTSSRFKGYFTFRKTKAELEAAAKAIAEPIVDVAVRSGS